MKYVLHIDRAGHDLIHDLKGTTPEDRKKAALDLICSAATDDWTHWDSRGAAATLDGSIRSATIYAVDEAQTVHIDVDTDPVNPELAAAYYAQKQKMDDEREARNENAAYSDYLKLKDRFESKMTPEEHRAHREKFYDAPRTEAAKEWAKYQEQIERYKIAQSLKGKKWDHREADFAAGYEQGLAEAREAITKSLGIGTEKTP